MSDRKKIDDILTRKYIIVSVPASRRTIFVDLRNNIAKREGNVFGWETNKFFLKFPEILFAFETSDDLKNYNYNFVRAFYRYNHKLYACILPNQDSGHRFCLGKEFNLNRLWSSALKATIIKDVIELFFNTKFQYGENVIDYMMPYDNAVWDAGYRHYYHKIDRTIQPYVFFEKWEEGSKSPEFNILDCSFLTSISLDEFNEKPDNVYFLERFIKSSDIIPLKEILSLAKGYHE